MGISARKIQILFKKDFKDILKNISISISMIIPLFFAVLYKYLFSDIPMPRAYLLMLVLALNLTMTAVMIPATSIAEEREKNTLRTLALSNVSGFEFCMAKMLVTSFFLLVTNVIIFLLMGEAVRYLPAFIVITVIGAVPLIVLGAAVGLAARDQMTAGVYEIPLMLVFLFPTIFSDMNSVAEKIADLTPCNTVVELVLLLTDGNFLSKETLFPTMVTLAWIVVAIGIFIWLFRRKGVDN